MQNEQQAVEKEQPAGQELTAEATQALIDELAAKIGPDMTRMVMFDIAFVTCPPGRERETIDNLVPSFLEWVALRIGLTGDQITQGLIVANAVLKQHGLLTPDAANDGQEQTAA